jgi:hypothetical protein
MNPLSQEAKRELNHLNKLDVDALDMARDLYDVSMKQKDYEKANMYVEIETYLSAERIPNIYETYPDEL